MSYRTRLRRAAEEPANFDGHFGMAIWGCGTECVTGAVVDHFTGRVVFLPFTICCSAEIGKPDFEPVVFRLASSLVVFAGKRNEAGDDAAHFYRFTGEEFVYIGSYSYDSTLPPAPAQRATSPTYPAHEEACASVRDPQERLSCYDVIHPPVAAIVNSHTGDKKAEEVSDEQARFITEREVQAYAQENGESVDQFAKRIGSTPEKLKSFVYASVRLGGSASAALRSMEGFALALKDPDKLKLLRCMNIRTTSDPSEKRPPQQECSKLRKSFGLASPD